MYKLAESPEPAHTELAPAQDNCKAVNKNMQVYMRTVPPEPTHTGPAPAYCSIKAENIPMY